MLQHSKNTQPIVSIVTGIYNSGSYLLDYFYMLKIQTFQNWEAILVDDGSTDNSCELIEEQCRIDSRIRLIRKIPEGFPSRSRAVGLAEAKGVYVAFCDHDDFWAPQKLEFQVLALEKFADASIVHTNRIVWLHRGRPSEEFYFKGHLDAIPIRRQLPEQVIYQGLQIIFSSFIGPKALIQTVGFHPEMKGVDDFYLFIRLAQLGSIYQIDLPLTYYYAHSHNLSHEKNIFVEGFYKVHQILANDAVPDHVKRSIYAQACRTEGVALMGINRTKALKLLLKSLKVYFIPSTLNRLLFLLATFFIPSFLQVRLFQFIKIVKFEIPTLADIWKKPRGPFNG